MQKTTTPLLLAALTLSVIALFRPDTSPALAETARLADESIAVVALPTLINELMASDRFQPDRVSYTEELNDELRQISERGRELSTRLQQMDPEDPGAQDLFAEMTKLSETLGRLQRENARKVEAHTASQIKECNELVRSSARAVADDLDFAFVISSADPDEELTDQSVEVLLRQLTSRPMIKFPEENDITSEVRDDLNLE